MKYEKDTMTPKERLLSAIGGKEVDRLPWSPFLAYFWESQPKSIQEMGQLQFLEQMGADPLMRGFHTVWASSSKNCTTSETTRGGERRVVYETPVGSLTEIYRQSLVGNTWFLTEHPVKTCEDFKVLAYINEQMEIVPSMAKFNSEYDWVGERALFLPLIGSEGKTCFQSLVEHWVGTEELVYALADYPAVVEECLQTMGKNSIRTAEISAECKAEAFIFWEDSSTTNISPAYFEKYTATEINAWGKVLHAAGKYLVHHACGHLKALLPIMAGTEIDMIESISPPPTGNIELWEAKALLPDTIGLIGGIEPTVFLNSSMEELEAYVGKLIEKMKGGRFILANSDSCPPGVALEKFRLVTEVVNKIHA